MAKLVYKPVAHNHDDFLKRASRKRGFRQAYNGLAEEYLLVCAMLEARQKAGLTQEVVAVRMGTTKSAVSRLESGARHTPSLASLRKYAQAVNCHLEIRLVPISSKQRLKEVRQ